MVLMALATVGPTHPDAVGTLEPNSPLQTTLKASRCYWISAMTASLIWIDTFVKQDDRDPFSAAAVSWWYLAALIKFCNFKLAQGTRMPDLCNPTRGALLTNNFQTNRPNEDNKWTKRCSSREALVAVLLNSLSLGFMVMHSLDCRCLNKSFCELVSEIRS